MIEYMLIVNGCMKDDERLEMMMINMKMMMINMKMMMIKMMMMINIKICQHQPVTRNPSLLPGNP